ncbi:MarR family transcriptional regulator [Amycolatopsis acidiphila]|uniref:MarR family transcriptional regulator n=1 Tax=Amycolatopsis acidiphila TaxID=715473 RepID=A0A558ADF8_9PSEU|nr:MarR family transcriptional regulator [Amycolatopsis acidiphila]TVT22302.1 MarR family transcriptional regulator [Amycolatopsis acidiphila]UIJ57983.1 MarR family transcriptional regulator [Amycolatopsis acidiphila]GHG70716.1 MarR family transcriptional regulator [Amycolatopsis acidiphila]
MHADRTANLLGAAALAVTDLVLARAQQRAGVSASGAAALVVVSAAPGLSVTELGRRVGLSQSAAARMVDSLETSGLLRRQPGQGREVAVHLTTGGRATARKLLDTRGSGLAGVLENLDADEQQALAGLLDKMLRGLYDRVGNAELLCRLCDRDSCTTGAVCPVGQAERDRTAGS